MTAPPSPNRAHSLGRLGEHHAARFLERRGWEILARNYRFGRREVDLVARRGRVLAFVEVKTRSGDGFGTPAEAITWRKRREIEAVAAYFLATGRGAEDQIRFDAIAVTVPGGGGTARVEHLPDAWRPGWP